MKLIFINRYFYPDLSATSQLLSDLAFYLSEQGYDVHVVTNSRCYNAPSSRFPQHSAINDVKIHRVWTSNLSNWRLRGRAFDYLSFYFTATWKLFRVVRHEDMVIALTDPPVISVTARLVTRLRRARMINWLQDIFPEVAAGVNIVKSDTLLIKFLQWLRNRSLFMADANVVIGKHMGILLKQYKIPIGGIHIIPNWADGSVIYPLKHKNNALRHKWNLQNKFVVGYSGNLGRAHEYNTLLNAARQLTGQDDIVFLFIGSGYLLAKLQQEVENEGLQNFIFKPYQARNHLHESLSVADVHWISLRPSLEGLIVPSKFYGVIAAGRPVLMIGDLNGEISTLLQEHDCGYAIAKDDSSLLTKKILYLRDNSEIHQQLGANARKLFDESYTQQSALSKWKKVIDKYVNT